MCKLRKKFTWLFFIFRYRCGIVVVWFFFISRQNNSGHARRVSLYLYVVHTPCTHNNNNATK